MCIDQLSKSMNIESVMNGEGECRGDHKNGDCYL